MTTKKKTMIPKKKLQSRRRRGSYSVVDVLRPLSRFCYPNGREGKGEEDEVNE